MRVLDFVLRQGGPFAYTDLSVPVFVNSKPLDLEESNCQMAHLRKRGRTKVACIVEQCNKRFRNSDELCAHLREHPQFCGRSEEEQDELINRLTFQ